MTAGESDSELQKTLEEINKYKPEKQLEICLYRNQAF